MLIAILRDRVQVSHRGEGGGEGKGGVSGATYLHCAVYIHIYTTLWIMVLLLLGMFGL